MKKLFLTLIMTVFTTAVLQAQQISVVSSGGATTLYRTLQEAIEGASNGSVIYLPGGSFSSNDVKITKKLTIIGIGHKSNNDNVDGVTTISGNLWFNEDSSGSVVMGCYITGDVNIGADNTAVNDILIRFCNLNSVNVKNSNCTRTTINQNYIRSRLYFPGADGIVSNNIVGEITMCGGVVCNNVFNKGLTNYIGFWNNTGNISVTDNVFIIKSGAIYYFPSFEDHAVVSSHNLFIGNREWGEDCLTLPDLNGSDVFKNDDGITSTSDYHFQNAYKEYESQYGIYSGSSFNDNQMAPVPYIIAKDIKEQTDASGKLHIKIRVKAGE